MATPSVEDISHIYDEAINDLRLSGITVYVYFKPKERDFHYWFNVRKTTKRYSIVLGNITWNRSALYEGPFYFTADTRGLGQKELQDIVRIIDVIKSVHERHVLKELDETSKEQEID